MKSQLLVASKVVLTSELGEEVALMHRETGFYFGLDEVGALLWRRLQSPASLEELVQRVLDEYEVDPVQCRGDLTRLLDELLEHGLIEKA